MWAYLTCIQSLLRVIMHSVSWSIITEWNNHYSSSLLLGGCGWEWVMFKNSMAEALPKIFHVIKVRWVRYLRHTSNRLFSRYSFTIIVLWERALSPIKMKTGLTAAVYNLIVGSCTLSCQRHRTASNTCAGRFDIFPLRKHDGRWYSLAKCVLSQRWGNIL